MSIEKIKSAGTFQAKFNHNYREVFVDNADPFLKHMNEELIVLPENSDGSKQTYYDFYKKRIDEQSYYKDHNIRSNAVQGLEIVMTFSREEKIDIEHWKKKNIEWLEKTFNVAGDGKNNIASVVYHADEAGNAHCHAVVIPIDERGHLNASRFTDGSRTLAKLQTSYAKEMEELGLERGLKGSQAKHKDIKKYYAELNQALKLPEIKPGESAIDYMQRYQESLQTLSAAEKRKRDQEYRKHTERMTKEYNSHREKMSGEYERQKSEISKQLSDKKEQVVRLQKQIDSMTVTHKALGEQLDKIDERLKIEKDIDSKVQFAELFLERYKKLAKLHPEKANELNDIIKEMNDLNIDDRKLEFELKK